MVHGGGKSSQDKSFERGGSRQSRGVLAKHPEFGEYGPKGYFPRRGCTYGEYEKNQCFCWCNGEYGRSPKLGWGVLANFQELASTVVGSEFSRESNNQKWKE
jgi:hypothetical protein